MPPRTCVFLKKEIDFNGMPIGKSGVAVIPEKVKILPSWPKPRLITEAWSFRGLFQFFQRFTLKLAKMATPFTNHTKKGLECKIGMIHVTKLSNAQNLQKSRHQFSSLPTGKSRL